MSHFTYIKTRFRNLSYLKKALNEVTATKLKQFTNLTYPSHIDLVIKQTNGYDINFIWNGQEYELVTDFSFWSQAQSVETFIDKVAQSYARELVTVESQKIGFQSSNIELKSDGSTKLVLGRWNTKTL